MKKIYMMLMLAGLSLMGVSCGGGDNTTVDPDPPIVVPDKPDNPVTPPSYPTFDAPNWSVSEASSYEHTMAVAIILPDSLRSNEDATDELAVFAQDNKCRGVAERLNVSEGNYIWMAMVYGNTSSDVLQFHYYSNKSKHKYYSAGTIPFEIDGVYGTIDAPKTIGMKIVTSK